MDSIIAEIRSYPVKGLSGRILSRTHLQPDETIQGDRRFALGRPGFAFDTDNPVWMPKTNFLALVRDEKLAELDAGYDEETDTLTLRADDRVVLAAKLSTPDGRSRVEAFFGAFLADTLDGPPTLLAAGAHSFSDLDAKVVSLLNLDSVAALGREIGVEIDPRRFRANISFRGTPAWRELDWVGRRFRIGGAAIEVIARTQRCAATNVNPETATRDLNLPGSLQRSRGHADMGVYARIIAPGDIRPGGSIVPMS